MKTVFLIISILTSSLYISYSQTYKLFYEAGKDRFALGHFTISLNNFNAAKNISPTQEVKAWIEIVSRRIQTTQTNSPKLANELNQTYFSRLKIYSSVLQKDTLYIREYQRVEATLAAKQEMLFIAGSESTIGSDSPLFPSENPSHRVRIRSFWIDKLEVGNQEYCEFLNKKGSYADSLGRIYIAINNPDCQITYSRRVFTVKSGYEKLPVTMVTWYGAEAYAKWAGKRLPYEAEWEYACKGGMLVSNTLLSNTEQYAWSRANTLSKSPMPRGTKKPNLLNLYDMLGNVWEWCADWYSDEYYQGRFLTMYQGPQEGTKKVCRGGASNSLEMFLHPSVRQGEDPNKQSLFIGFRCARDQ